MPISRSTGVSGLGDSRRQRLGHRNSDQPRSGGGDRCSDHEHSERRLELRRVRQRLRFGWSTVTCSIGSLARDDSRSVSITYSVTASSGSESHTTSVGGDQVDPTAGNNTDTKTADVILPEVNLELVFTDARPGPVART